MFLGYQAIVGCNKTSRCFSINKFREAIFSRAICLPFYHPLTVLYCCDRTTSKCLYRRWFPQLRMKLLEVLLHLTKNKILITMMTMKISTVEYFITLLPHACFPGHQPHLGLTSVRVTLFVYKQFMYEIVIT